MLFCSHEWREAGSHFVFIGKARHAIDRCQSFFFWQVWAKDPVWPSTTAQGSNGNCESYSCADHQLSNLSKKTWHVLCVINFIQHFFWLYFVLCAQLLKGKFPPFWSFMEGPGGSEAYGNASELEAIIFNGTSLQPEAQMGHVEMEEILHQLRLVVYPIIYRVWYIPGGAGYQPSTVVFMSLNLFVAGEDCMITVFDTISCLHVWNSESDVGADGCFQVWSSSSGGHDIQSWSLVAILWLILHRYLH